MVGPTVRHRPKICALLGTEPILRKVKRGRPAAPPARRPARALSHFDLDDLRSDDVKRVHRDSHDQLRSHLADFMAAYNSARRLRTLGGLTPYDYICNIWTSEPDRSILDPIHQMPGLNS